MATIAGTMTGTVIGFASLVASLVLGTHQWKQRKERCDA